MITENPDGSATITSDDKVEFKPVNIIHVRVKDPDFRFQGTERHLNFPCDGFIFRCSTVRQGLKDLWELWDNIYEIDITNRDGEKVKIYLSKEMRGDI